VCGLLRLVFSFEIVDWTSVSLAGDPADTIDSPASTAGLVMLSFNDAMLMLRTVVD